MKHEIPTNTITVDRYARCTKYTQEIKKKLKNFNNTRNKVVLYTSTKIIIILCYTSNRV